MNLIVDLLERARDQQLEAMSSRSFAATPRSTGPASMPTLFDLDGDG